jgi:hypothetical protein
MITPWNRRDYDRVAVFFAGMDAAGAIGTGRAVQAVAIAGNPRVGFAGERVNTGDQQDPGE